MSLPITQGKWVVDPSHTQIAFVARHLGFTKVRGTFSEYTLTVNVADSIEDSTLEASIALNSVDTGNEDRNNHLRSADFFGASPDPTMTFKSTSITGNPEKFIIEGELTLNGITKPVSFDAEFGGSIEDPYKNTKALFEASTELNRTDWGIDWNVPVGSGMLVSEKVKVELDIQLIPAT